MRSFPYPTLLLIALGLALGSAISASAVAASGEVGGNGCPASEVIVHGATEADFYDTCVGAGAALEFFANMGVYPTAPLSIVVAWPLPSKVGPTAAGCYLKESNRIYVLPFQEFEKQETWFDVPIDRAMYQSLAAHEAAHAIASCNFKMPNPTIQAQEYVAYAATFSTMSQILRERALASCAGKGFTDPDRITGIRYMVDPMRFAVDSYCHYVRPGNGPRFLQEIFRGSVLTD